MPLRPYQEAAVDGVLRELAGVRSTLVVAPTGCGKTVILAEVCRLWLAADRGRVLVLAHREELIAQACDKITTFAGLSTTVEMADRHATADAPIVVASVQTIAQPRRREAFGPEAFGLIIVDEAHHAPAASYRAILDYFPNARVLGMTATPDRCDGAALGKVFDSVAFRYEIRDAIDEGHLVPIRQRAVHVAGLDLSSVRTTAGDLNEGDLEAILTQEQNLHGVAAPVVELAGDRPTLVFAATVAHAHALAEVIARHGRSVRALDGSAPSDERRRVLDDFASGKLSVLVNCALFTEGFDEPSIACVAIARPTKSRALYAQMVGRGTRLAPPDKRDLLVLDFEGNAGKHSLVSVADILGGEDSDTVRARARKLAKGGEMLVTEALDKARAEAAAAARRALIVARARYHATEVDPFAVLGAQPKQSWWAGEPVSDKQAEVLARNGIDPKSLTKGEASGLIDEIIARQRRGLCTFRQAKVLARYGLDPDVNGREASELIAAIAGNGWRVPEALHARNAGA